MREAGNFSGLLPYVPALSGSGAREVSKGGAPCAAEAPGAGEAWAEGILTYPDTRMMNESVEDIDNQPRVLRAYDLTSTVRSSRCRSCAAGGIELAPAHTH